MSVVELGRENCYGTDTQTIKNLKEKGYIYDSSPLWWSTENNPDPRELLSFNEFKNRLLPTGQLSSEMFLDDYGPANQKVKKRNLCLYPFPKVPMSIIELNIEGQSLPFLITARPYHRNELGYSPLERNLEKYPTVYRLRQAVKSGENIRLLDHFHPHIRGLFAGKINEHYFWYPIVSLYKNNFVAIVRNSLEEKDLPFFVDIYKHWPGFDFWGSRKYQENWFELSNDKKSIDLKSLCQPDYPYKEVSPEEFLEDLEKNENLVVRYPYKAEGYEHPWTLILSNKTHIADNSRKPVILGLYADNGAGGFCNRSGIARIKNRILAEQISETITNNLGISVDTVLFTPQKGRPKYELVKPPQTVFNTDF